MRKGQHLALESAATFGLTLIAALGVIHAFNMVNQGVIDSTQSKQIQIATDRVKSAMLQMSYLSDNERGFKQVEIPKKAGNQDYRIAISKSGVKVFVANQKFSNPLNIGRPSDEIRGAVDSGSVKLFKTRQGYNLREGR
ncbi:MAG: hypothetical protein ABEJ87_01075 [Candidatus Nanohalobium sp.]